MNREIKITDASHSELLTFARDTLGLNLPPNTKVETLRAKISTCYLKDHILVAEVDPNEPKQAGPKPEPVTDDQAEPKQKMVRIHINITEDAGGSDDVQVGVNGVVHLIKRGKDVDVPESYVEVLEHAITHIYDALPNGGMNPVPREVMLYPFQRVA